MMGTTPQRLTHTFLAGFVCLLLAVPAEVHSTLVEVNAHDVEGTISIGARHADQAAHFEHSTQETRERCAACTLTETSKKSPLSKQTKPQRMRQAGKLLPSEPRRVDSTANRHTPSRAPPLL